MGNSDSVCQVTNNSKRNVRVFLTDKPLAIDAIITSESKKDDHNPAVLSTDKKFSFWKDVSCTRVLASESREVKHDHYMNIFVEDEDDENICSKQILHNVVASAPFNILIYDV